MVNKFTSVKHRFLPLGLTQGLAIGISLVLLGGVSCSTSPEDYLVHFLWRFSDTVEQSPTEPAQMTSRLTDFWQKEKSGVEQAVQELHKKMAGLHWQQMESYQKKLMYLKRRLAQENARVRKQLSPCAQNEACRNILQSIWLTLQHLEFSSYSIQKP